MTEIVGAVMNGQLVKTIKFYDNNAQQIGEAELPKTMCLGKGDKCVLEFRWKDDDLIQVDMTVICPECERNPLPSSVVDFMCPACREVMGENDAA